MEQARVGGLESKVGDASVWLMYVVRKFEATQEGSFSAARAGTGWSVMVSDGQRKV